MLVSSHFVGVQIPRKVKDADSKNAYSESAESSDSDSAEDSTDDGDEISFYGKPVTDND